MTHVHLIGIGGTGLSAIARVLLEKGYQVSGSDRQASPLFDAVTQAGATTYVGHVSEQVSGADLVVRSSAVPDDNPEVQYALAHQIPVLKRSDFLAELTQGQDVLAVAGTHGKTTTTTMLIWMLIEMGLDPSFIAGGVVNQLNRNAHAGQGDYFVIEADEYDNMFLGLAPKIAIVTNMEHDHPDCFPTPRDYRKAFKSFLGKVRSDGLAFVCQDDPGAASLGEEMSAEESILTYGSRPEVNYRAINNVIVDGWPTFTLMYGDEALGQVKLAIPGWHNVLNATGALGAIHQLGLDLPAAIRALVAFTGAGRRFEVLGEVSGVTIIDDYGHHPTEIAATLEAAHSRYQNHRIWAIWQPHTYSRTQSLEAEFISALAIADRVGVLKIYAAREKDPGYSARVIADALPAGKAAYLDDFGAATEYLLQEIKPNDVLIIFSAGDATQVSQSVYQQLTAKEIG
ncbi:UDP-N-acetylmuramate--L-alanine ligase [Chloroflexota bacterium]|nr:UDP-N-acetylmuramate--L-alanine ligase [Chloroflexota bacterium]